MRDAWVGLTNLFAIRRDRKGVPTLPGSPKIYHDMREFPQRFLEKHAVDIIIVDLGTDNCQVKDYSL